MERLNEPIRFSARRGLEQARTPRPFGVGVIGLEPDGWYWCERIGLRDDVFLAAVWDADPLRQRWALEQGWPLSSNVADLWSAPQVSGVIILASWADRAELINQALSAGKHVLVKPPLTNGRDTADTLYREAHRQGLCLWSASPQRWDEDLHAAKAALLSGRLGKLHSLRYQLWEWAPGAGENTTACAHLRDQHDLGDHLLLRVLDQLGELVDLNIRDLRVRSHPFQRGFTCEIILEDLVLVQIELRCRSLVHCQTGWLLEGEEGAYRSGRLYTLTSEGEIVDEPVRTDTSPPDVWLAEWLARCQSPARDTEAGRSQKLMAVYEQFQQALERER